MRGSSSILILMACLSTNVRAQFSFSDALKPAKESTSSSYLFPVNPGHPNLLAGTMGELRSTHFHSGIDVRTNNMVGVPILATQRGYISHIIVGAYGYGHAMLITHPDGNTSLYGHLDQFKGAITKHIIQEQYRRKSFDLDIEFSANQFPVNRGDTIGLSGNTGGSSGPHLHFEIRNENKEALNPLTFGFTEIEDKLAPIGLRIALKTLDINSRVNDRFGRYEFGLVRNGKTARLPYPILVRGKIGIEILAHDKIDHSQFRHGINHIELYADSTLIFKQDIDKIDFNTSRDILTLMDFRTLKAKGVRFNKLYIEDGNPLQFYKDVLSRGAVTVENGTKKIKIILRDFSDNESVVTFTLQADPLTENVTFIEPLLKPVDFEIQENILVVSTKPCGQKEKTIKLFSKGNATEITSTYRHPNRLVYLIDLKKTLPDSIQTCAGAINFNFKDIVPSLTDYTYYSDWADIEFPNRVLYDTLFLNIAQSKRNQFDVFSIGTATTPIHNGINVILKPSNEYQNDKKIAAYHLEGNRFEYLGGEWNNGRINFTTPELGDFALVRDSIPPSVSRISCTNLSARFRIRDNLSGIAKIEATINGEWLLMKYDYKTGIVQSDRLDKTKQLKGDFQLKITDRAGNEKLYTQKIL